MRFVPTLLLALGLAVTTARADVKKAPPPPSEVDAATVKKLMAFFDKLIDVIVANKDDCKKMASGITSLVDANKALLEEARRAQEAGKKLPPDAEKQMMERFQKAGAAIQKCIEDKDVQAALQRMAPAKK